jgi:hypothetical protein
MLGIFEVAVQLAVSQEGLISKKLWSEETDNQ